MENIDISWERLDHAVVWPAVVLGILFILFGFQRSRFGSLWSKTTLSAIYGEMILYGCIGMFITDLLLQLGMHKNSFFLPALISAFSGTPRVDFSMENDLDRIVFVLAVAVFIVSIFVWWWFDPHLGDLRVPATLYFIMLSCMVLGALLLVRHPQVPLEGSLLAFWGGTLVWISDFFVAQEKFVRSSPVNRVFNVPLYFGGQFLLAYSISLV